jgi:hypothetical protein
MSKNASEIHAAMCTADCNRTPLNLQKKTTAFKNLNNTCRKLKHGIQK